MTTADELRIDPPPTPEEVAAIMAALRSRPAAEPPAQESPASRWLRVGRAEAVGRWDERPPTHPWRRPPR